MTSAEQDQAPIKSDQIFTGTLTVNGANIGTIAPSVLHHRLPTLVTKVVGYVAVNKKTGKGIETGSTPYGKRPRVYKTVGSAKSAMSNSNSTNRKLFKEGGVDIIPVYYSVQVE